MTKHLTFTAIITALALVIMFLGSLSVGATIATAGVAGALIIALMIECNVFYSISSYIITSALSFTLFPTKSVAIYYIVILGYYPIIKSYFEKIKVFWLQWIVKLAAFNAAFAILFVITLFVVSLPINQITLFGINAIYIIWPVANAVFIVYDICLTFLANFYLRYIHSRFNRR